MGAQGSTQLDFGAFPGSSHTTVAVTGQTGLVAASANVEAWVEPDTTADHSPDEHVVEPLKVIASDVQDGQFVIHGLNDNYLGDTMLVGVFNVGWVWN